MSEDKDTRQAVIAGAVLSAIPGNIPVEYQYTERFECDGVNNVADYITLCDSGVEICPDDEAPTIRRRDGAVVLRMWENGQYMYELLWLEDCSPLVTTKKEE